MPSGLDNSTKEEEKDGSHRNVSPPVTLLPQWDGPQYTLHVAMKMLMGMPLCLYPDLHVSLIREVPILDFTSESQGSYGKNQISRLNFLQNMKAQEVCSGWYTNVQVFYQASPDDSQAWYVNSRNTRQGASGPHVNATVFTHHYT